MRRPLLALLVAAAIVGAVEVALRVAVGLDALLFAYEQPSSLQPVAGLEGSAGITRQDGPYSWTSGLDRDGLREGGRVRPEAPAETTRILAVGDSWIFGHAADEGDTLPDQLEVLLAGKLGAPKVEVVNAGVPGASAGVIARRAHGHLRRLRGLAGVLIGQPHNGPGKGGPPPAGPPPVAIYRALRLWIAPYTWDTPPRANGPTIADEVAIVRDLVAEVRGMGLAVWFVPFPQERRSALSGRFPPEPEWTALDVPMAGHGLVERACWSFEDPFHPSAAGYRAIAEVVAAMILDGRHQTEWATEPSCHAVPGVGPGKE
ncbi:MAG: SGNH/GDSL hydrolase family protein [Myxococcota bacterium]